jgi:hypothetical protein
MELQIQKQILANIASLYMLTLSTGCTTNLPSVSQYCNWHLTYQLMVSTGACITGRSFVWDCKEW